MHEDLQKYVIIIDHLPDAVLSPNSHVHWTKKYDASQAAKDEIGWLMRQNGGAGKPITRARISYEFHFKNRHIRDFDNLFSSCKPWQDGLVVAGVIARDDFEHLEIGFIRAMVTGHAETIITVEEFDQ